jgi:hypothetical protein
MSKPVFRLPYGGHNNGKEEKSRKEESQEKKIA